MSWFSKFIQHPAMNALAGLASHPAIAGNPGAQAAVAEAQNTATTIATATSSAAHTIEATVTASADPLLADVGAGLQSAVDAYLMSFGPPGFLAVPAANAVIAMGEQYAHSYIAALFSHAKWAHADAVANAPDPAAAKAA